MPVNLHTVFLQNVRRRMSELGMTQRDLAKSMGVTEAYVSRLLAGKNVPSLEMPGRLAPHLGTTPLYLLTPSEPEKPEKKIPAGVDAA